MPRPTHRYTGTKLYRVDDTVLERGDLCTPTDAELRSFGDCFEQLPSEEVPNDAPPEAGYEPEEPAEPPHGEAVDDAARAREVLRENGIDPDEYRELQSAAADYDDVKGNLPAGELQLRLAAKLA